MEAEIVKLGTIRLSGFPRKPRAKYTGANISFGDTVPGKELQWVKDDRLLYADRCACLDVSWDQLDAQGYVYGRPVIIDGHRYLCRCLKVGAKEAVKNEWSSLLVKYGEDNELWHWKDQFFWGQEASANWYPRRIVRAHCSPTYFGHCESSWAAGFRPVLEPLGPEPALSDSLIGKKIRVYGAPGPSILGKLVDFDEYDLVLNSSHVPVGSPWIRTGKGNVIVDRTYVSWIRKA